MKGFIDNINYTHFKGDISDAIFLEEIFLNHKFDVVVNLAAQAGVRYSIENPMAYINSNVVGFTNILECCRNANISHLVYASSSSVYGANSLIPFSIHDNVDHPKLICSNKKSNELMAHSYSNLYNISHNRIAFLLYMGLGAARPSIV